MIQALIALLLSVLVIAGAFYAYNEGILDPYIEQIGIYFFKAKAMAEKKRLQAEGMKAGEDFADSQLKGVQQAEDVKLGIGSFAGLKKDL